jgi:RNA polymerase primary sigma factor
LYAWQKEAVAAWKSQRHLGVVEAVTGAGKSLVGIIAAMEQIKLRGFVLIIVPTLELLTQWERSIKEYLPDSRIGIFGGGTQATFRNHDVIISTVNAARRRDLLPPNTNGLLIADEVHRLGSESNKDALDERFTRRLGLSATYQRNDNGTTDWLEPYFGETCFLLDYERALRDKVISDFSVSLVGVMFSAAEYAKYEKLTQDVSRLRRRLINEYGLPEEPYGEFMKGVQHLIKGPKESAIIAGTYNSAFNKRRRLLAESPAKIKALSKLLSAIRSSTRVLIFTQTIESAENIGDYLRSHSIDAEAVHSQTKKKDRKRILDDFGEGKLQVVVAPNILNEGIDVPEADLGIIVAGSKIRREMIQRMGRVLRPKRDGRIARFALIFIEQTSEDPAQGAHEDFIEEMTRVARSCEVFRNNVSSQQICEYLNAE